MFAFQQIDNSQNILRQIHYHMKVIKNVLSVYVINNRGDQRGGMHTNEKSHVKFITIDCNGPYERRKRSDLNPSRSV